MRFLVFFTVALSINSTSLSQDQFVPIEEHFDGTIDDDDPVSWEPGARTQGTFEFDNGDLLLTGQSVSAIATSGGVPVIARDTLAQARVHFTGPTNMWAGMFTRSPNGFTSYGGGLFANGSIFAGVDPPDGPAGFTSSPPSDLRPTEHDVMIESVTVGNTITFSAWDARLPNRPLDPLSVTFVDPGNSFVAEGPLGLALDNGGGGEEAIVRFREFNIVPEPNAFGLITCGALGLLCGRWRRA